MKNFILGLGRFFINFGVIVQLIAIVAASIAVGNAVYSLNYNNSDLAILSGIGTFIILFIIIVMSNFMLYLILGMHDSFVSMSESLSLIAKNIYINSDISDYQSQNVKQKNSECEKNMMK